MTLQEFKDKIINHSSNQIIDKIANHLSDYELIAILKEECDIPNGHAVTEVLTKHNLFVKREFEVFAEDWAGNEVGCDWWSIGNTGLIIERLNNQSEKVQDIVYTIQEHTGAEEHARLYTLEQLELICVRLTSNNP